MKLDQQLKIILSAIVFVQFSYASVAQDSGFSWSDKLETDASLTRESKAKDANMQREFRKTIYEYDPYDYTIADPSVNTAGGFWRAVCDNNEMVKKLMTARTKNNSLWRKAAADVNEVMAGADEFWDGIPDWPCYQDIISNLLKAIDIRDLCIKVCPLDELNAGMYPHGKMIMTSKMMDDSLLTYENILGVCAHEAVHYVLLHQLSQFYSEYKKERSNTIIAAAVMASNVAGNTYAAANGVDIDWDAEKEWNDDFKDGMVRLVYERYHFRYARKLEIQADIIAYRFLQFIGVGGDKYIDVLRRQYLEEQQEKEKNKKILYHYDNPNVAPSDHPETSYRIALLDYISVWDKHPEWKTETFSFMR